MRNTSDKSRLDDVLQTTIKFLIKTLAPRRLEQDLDSAKVGGKWIHYSANAPHYKHKHEMKTYNILIFPIDLRKKKKLFTILEMWKPSNKYLLGNVKIQVTLS